MRNLKEKLNSLMIGLSVKAMNLKEKTTEKLSEEDGDTNFLSIMIVLGIVLVVAVLFIAFKDQIMDAVSSAWNSFADAFNTQKDNKDDLGLNAVGG